MLTHIPSIIQAILLLLLSLCPLSWGLLCPAYYRQHKLLRSKFSIRDIQALYLFESACLLLCALLVFFH